MITLVEFGSKAETFSVHASIGDPVDRDDSPRWD